MPEKVSIIKESGETVSSNVVSAFTIPDKGKNYLITTENTVDPHGLTVLHVSEIVDGALSKIASDDEWTTIKNVMRSIISNTVSSYQYIKINDSYKVSDTYSRDISVSLSASKQMIEGYFNSFKESENVGSIFPSDTITPNTESEVVPGIVEQVNPSDTNQSAEATPEVPAPVTEVTPEATTEVPAPVTEVTPEATSEVPAPVTEVTPEATPEVPAPVTEATPEATPEVPTPVAEVTPEATTEVPAPVTEVTPEAPAPVATVTPEVSVSGAVNQSGDNTQALVDEIINAIKPILSKYLSSSSFDDLKKKEEALNQKEKMINDQMSIVMSNINKLQEVTSASSGSGVSSVINN